MHINLEKQDKHTIEAYSEKEIQINARVYQKSVIVSAKEIIEWSISSINELNEDNLFPFIKYQPKVIIIGHHHLNFFPSFAVVHAMAKRGIGLECMSLSAACRTFNILLNEQREVVAGFIF